MNKRTPAIIVFLIVLIACLYHFVGVPVITKLKTNDLKSTFVTEDNKLSIAKRLKLKASPSKSCDLEEKSSFNSKAVCFYGPNFGAAKVNQATYTAQSAAILSALRQNGWQVDNQTEYNYSKDRLSNVAYHKNLGPISCNLEIANVDSYGIFVNEYSCNRAVSVPDINFSTKIYGP